MSTSLQAFREWSVSAAGAIGNPVVNTYRGQCVSLVQQYLYQVFGVPYAARGHAKDFVPPTFQQVSGSPRPGDIVRYGSPYGRDVVNGQVVYYGHIELIDDEGKSLGQNRNFDGRVTRGAILSGYTLYRPTKSFTLKKPSNGGSTSGGKTVNETDLTAIYQYGPLALGGYQARSRKSKEGSDVYLGRTAAFVLKDHFNSSEANKKRAAVKKQIDDLQKSINTLKSQAPGGGAAATSDAEKKLKAIKDALGIK